MTFLRLLEVRLQFVHVLFVLGFLLHKRSSQLLFVCNPSPAFLHPVPKNALDPGLCLAKLIDCILHVLGLRVLDASLERTCLHNRHQGGGLLVLPLHIVGGKCLGFRPGLRFGLWRVLLLPRAMPQGPSTSTSSFVLAIVPVVPWRLMFVRLAHAG